LKRLRRPGRFLAPCGSCLLPVSRFPQLAWGGENAGTIIWCDYNPVRVRTFSLIRPMPGPMFMGDDATVLFLTVIAAIPVAAQQLSASFRSSLARTHQLRLQLSSRS
jgi:hypothetical protein